MKLGQTSVICGESNGLWLLATPIEFTLKVIYIQRTSKDGIPCPPNIRIFHFKKENERYFRSVKIPAAVKLVLRERKMLKQMY